MILPLAAFVLASATFAPNTRLPVTSVYNKCGGANVSPELHWQGAPAKTHSFALIAYDPDATGGWYHWVAYNISASAHSIPAGKRLMLSQLGVTSFKQLGYGGPCPPPGKIHHYIFTLYALDLGRLRHAGMTGPQLEATIRRHVLGRASVTGLYSK